MPGASGKAAISTSPPPSRARSGIDGSLDPESGQSVLVALGAIQDAWAKDGTRDPRSAPQRRADALVELCRAWLDRSDRPRVGGERPHVVLTVDLQSLQGTWGRSELEDTGPITAETARRLACDAGISRIITMGASEPLDVGRRYPGGSLRDAQGSGAQGRRLSVPRVWQTPVLVRCPPHQALGRRWFHRLGEPRAALPSPPPCGARKVPCGDERSRTGVLRSRWECARGGSCAAVATVEPSSTSVLPATPSTVTGTRTRPRRRRLRSSR